jgi:hypothetical protein
MAKVTERRCEYLRTPLGIDVARPRRIWQMLSDQRELRKLAYPFDDQMVRRGCYVTHDVTEHLRQGENVAGVRYHGAA